ncbi:MAG: hypothetical protein SPE06_09905 [[Actinobacillus] rossii]|nr:phage tail protein [[Actinobacillus] rossii]MDY4506669.1 hypothetical protein [[Actinobacillus] rossii]
MRDLLPKIDSEDGLFHNGNPATGTQGTRVNDTWLNNVQEHMRDFGIEIRYLLAKAELTADPAKQTQIYDAIKVIIGKERPLYSGYDSDSESLGATAKVIKILKGFIDSNTRSFANYIPNSKKSNAVNSTSSDTVATSFAAKTAYDKGVEALDKANTKADKTNPILTTNKWYGDMNTVPNGTLFFAITETTKNHPYSDVATFDAQAWQFDVGNQKIQMVFYSQTDIKIRLNDDGVNWSDWVSILTEQNLSGAVNNSSNTVPASVAGVKSAYERGTTALNQANTANNNANGRVSKSGDDVSGVLTLLSAAGKGYYSNQLNSEAPLFIPKRVRDGYYYNPMLKGIFGNSVSGYTAAFSFGYTFGTQDASWGRGIISYLTDSGRNKEWAFLDNGDFISAGDVTSASGKSLNNHSHAWSEITSKPSTIAGYGITDFNWENLKNKPSTATRWPTATEQGYDQSLGKIGWVRLPSGLIFQWGESDTAISGARVNFPIAFNTCFQVFLTDTTVKTDRDALSVGTTFTNTEFKVWGDAGLFSWFAIGR